MNDSNSDPEFNALTDAWLPLVQDDGASIWASPIGGGWGEGELV